MSQLYRCLAILLFGLVGGGVALAQAPAGSQAPTQADLLRGEYGPYRANNDLLSYDLRVRVDPEKKFISGK